MSSMDMTVSTACAGTNVVLDEAQIRGGGVSGPL
jgi:hypothetical protein